MQRKIITTLLLTAIVFSGCGTKQTTPLNIDEPAQISSASTASTTTSLATQEQFAEKLEASRKHNWNAEEVAGILKENECLDIVSVEDTVPDGGDGSVVNVESSGGIRYQVWIDVDGKVTSVYVYDENAELLDKKAYSEQTMPEIETESMAENEIEILREADRDGILQENSYEEILVMMDRLTNGTAKIETAELIEKENVTSYIDEKMSEENFAYVMQIAFGNGKQGQVAISEDGEIGSYAID